VKTKDEYVSEHFPVVNPGCRPCGNQVLVQFRTMKSASKGGIVLVNDTKDFNNGNTQLAMVVSLGQIAYRDRNSGEFWKEGAWATVGDVVVVPRWSGFRFEVPIPGTEDKAIFAIFEDFNLKIVVESNFEQFDTLL
jgi:co-chaperonin GroES (HSP10)